MKKSTKLGLGIGLTALIGASVAYAISDSVLEMVTERKNRKRIKGIVHDKLKGNERVMGFVDQLGSDDLAKMVTVADKFEDLKDRFDDYSDVALERAHELKDSALNYVEERRNRN